MPVLLTQEEEFEAWLNGAPPSSVRLGSGVSTRADADRAGGFKKQDLLKVTELADRYACRRRNSKTKVFPQARYCVRKFTNV